MDGRAHPNVVFIVGDNVGWGDIGCYGGLAPTPRLDALAAQGLRFKNYNVEAQCTPTRSALLTGRLPIRTGNCSVPLPGQGEYGLAPWEYTIGELFSDAGYATAAFGKWHVGEAEGRLPTDQGFDEWMGIKNTSDESAYSTYPLFAESGFPVPKIWEGVKGSHVTPVEDFNLDDARAAGREDCGAGRRLHLAQRQGRQAVLHLHLFHADAPAAHPSPGVQGQVGRRRLFRRAGRIGLPHRSGARRDRSGRHRRQHHRRLEQRQPGGTSHVDGRLERTVARPLRLRLRGRHAHAGDRALARQGESRQRDRRDLLRGRLVPDAGVSRWREEPRAHRPPDRRRRCVGVPPRQERRPPGGITSSTTAPMPRSCRSNGRR